MPDTVSPCENAVTFSSQLPSNSLCDSVILLFSSIHLIITLIFSPTKNRSCGCVIRETEIESIGKSLISYLNDTTITPIANNKNTLVGIVKSIQQFEFCIEKNIYYTYKKTLTSNPEEIKYVALYQTRSAFGFERAGILYYGKVKKLYHVKRSQIHFNIIERKKDADCIAFSVTEWKELNATILPAGNAKVLLLTTEQKLKSASIYTDL